MTFRRVGSHLSMCCFLSGEDASLDIPQETRIGQNLATYPFLDPAFTGRCPPWWPRPPQRWRGGGLPRITWAEVDT